MNTDKKIPRVKFASSFKGDTSKKTVDRIKELIKFGRKIEHRDLDPTKPLPKGHRRIYCYYFDNRIVKFHQNESSILVVKYFNNTRKKLNKKKQRKPLTFKHHAAERRLSRVVSNEEIENAIYHGIWVPDFKLDDNKYPRFDSRYYLDDLCVIVAERKDELKIQTVYRISPASDIDFIKYLDNLDYGPKNLSFYVIDQSKINRFIHSYESGLYREKFLETDDLNIVNNYADRLLEEIKLSVIYTSNKKLGIDIKWDSTLLHPKRKYSIGFLFESGAREYGNFSNSDKKFFRSLGLDINKNCFHGRLSSSKYNFALFDMSDYSGSSHIWAKTRVRNKYKGDDLCG